MNNVELDQLQFERKINQWLQKSVFCVKNGITRLNVRHDFIKKLPPEEREAIFDEYIKLFIELDAQDIETMNKFFWITYRNQHNGFSVKTIILEVLDSVQLDFEETFDKDDQESLVFSLLDAIVDTKKQKQNIKEVIKKSLIKWLQKWLKTREKNISRLVVMAKNSCKKNHAADASLDEELVVSFDPTHPEYDPAFSKIVRALRPDWFEE